MAEPVKNKCKAYFFWILRIETLVVLKIVNRSVFVELLPGRLESDSDGMGSAKNLNNQYDSIYAQLLLDKWDIA